MISESEEEMTTTRPLSWRIDAALGTTPLFDVLSTGPRHGVAEWLSSLALVIGKLASPPGRAWMRWRQAVWAGSPNEDALFKRMNAVTRLERMRRRIEFPLHRTGS